jgi:hypothetical protein
MTAVARSTATSDVTNPATGEVLEQGGGTASPRREPR